MPMPVSATAIAKLPAQGPPCGSIQAVSLTMPPVGVNLIAFVSKLSSICLSFMESARKAGKVSRIATANMTPRSRPAD